jgi:hypothetical protein
MPRDYLAALVITVLGSLLIGVLVSWKITTLAG